MNTTDTLWPPFWPMLTTKHRPNFLKICKFQMFYRNDLLIFKQNNHLALTNRDGVGFYPCEDLWKLGSDIREVFFLFVVIYCLISSQTYCYQQIQSAGHYFLLTGDRRQTKQFCFLDADCLVVGAFGREIPCETTAPGR